MKNNKNIKICDWCGEKIRNAWRKKYVHCFCCSECYQKWKKDNVVRKGEKQDWTTYRKLKWLVEKKNESFTNRVR